VGRRDRLRLGRRRRRAGDFGAGHATALGRDRPRRGPLPGDGIGRIRRVERATGRIHAFAGSGLRGYRGDGGPALEARMTQPFALAFGPDGALYFTDVGNHAVRRVDTAGRITTVVGDGCAGASPDGTPAPAAR